MEVSYYNICVWIDLWTTYMNLFNGSKDTGYLGEWESLQNIL
jgi:hypothetical protein